MKHSATNRPTAPLGIQPEAAADQPPNSISESIIGEGALAKHQVWSRQKSNSPPRFRSDIDFSTVAPTYPAHSPVILAVTPRVHSSLSPSLLRLRLSPGYPHSSLGLLASPIPLIIADLRFQLWPKNRDSHRILSHADPSVYGHRSKNNASDIELQNLHPTHNPSTPNASRIRKPLTV